MMRLVPLLLAVVATFAQTSFASSRLSNYDITQIGEPGSGRYVFCSADTCPEPTIKHLATSVPVAPDDFPLPVSSADESRPMRASTVPIVKRHISHRTHIRHDRRVAKVSNRALCTTAAPDASTSKHLADR
ncbi:hypothetical protein VL15_15135 [Burkholderia cepacia]|uniref:Uncharacterized protein n=1 Tax=Burkholderia cepacia TaxID=292 RepID=A0A0J5X1X7_BURCE|nr:hypothetical protein [Burkholderia cepacia]KML57052.1 hypothetical protein VL15_15135 [Burkholderia cepacia]